MKLVIQRPDFQVVRVEPDGLVIGRNCGSDVPLGTVFTVVEKVRIDGDALHLETVELGAIASIRLVLRSVQCYRRSLDAIPGGHTAGLRFDGDGLAELMEALRAKGAREYIHLRA